MREIASSSYLSSEDPVDTFFLSFILPLGLSGLSLPTPLMSSRSATLLSLPLKLKDTLDAAVELFLNVSSSAEASLSLLGESFLDNLTGRPFFLRLLDEVRMGEGASGRDLAEASSRVSSTFLALGAALSRNVLLTWS